MTGKMRAAVLKEFHKPLVIETMDIPTPGPDEVLVKVKASGGRQPDEPLPFPIHIHLHQPFACPPQ